MRTHAVAIGVTGLLLCLARILPAQEFRITEFMAANDGGLLDENGDASDWLEIQNVGPANASLLGWFLTDEPTLLAKWRLADTNVAADGFVVVFASGKNRANAGAPLHANFALNADGGYLALVHPDGASVASEFRYGPQFAGTSFGQGLGPTRTVGPLVAPNASLKYLVPSAPVPDTWRGAGSFDDASWSNGVFSAGFDANVGPVTIAYAVPPGTAGNQAYGGALGLDFDVKQTVQLTDLGCFDDSGNGIGAGITITVSLWRRNNAGTPLVPGDDTGAGILVSTNFTAASPGVLVGGQRFKALAVPLTLTNGSYTIVAYGYGAAERLANNLGVVTPNTGGGGLQFVGSSRYGDNTAAFPAIVDINIAQYAAGTFRFQTTPGANFGVNLVAMRNVNASVLLRVPFVLNSPESFAALTFDISYDDGFVAFLNGVEMARRNAPATLAFNAAATGSASERTSLDVSAFLPQLHAGANVLAIHGLNVSAGDADFVIDAQLAGERQSTNWVYFQQPTPGRANTNGLLFPRVVINEIHSDPTSAKSRPLEFIELYNPLATSVDLSGWSFTRGITFIFPAGTVMAPRGYLVVAENPPALAAQLGASALGPWVGSLANDGETLELVDATSTTIDRVSYGLGFPWPTVGDNDYSLQLIHEGLDHDLGGSWRSAPPTPARRNSVTQSNAPPQIRQVDHSPNQPISGEAVRITAKVTDPDGVSSVTLEYQIVEPGNYLTLTNPAFATNWTSLPMVDAGVEGDLISHDDIYTALIPAGVQQHRRLIRYRIRASDRSSLAVLVPYGDDPSPNFAYFVYDGVPAWSGAVQPGVTPSQLFGTNITRKARPYHLLSRSNDVWNCQYNGAFNDGLYRFEGALVVDGKVYDHMHYRVKGQNSTYNTGKNKWKFKFNRGHWLEMPDDYGSTHTTVEVLNVSSLPSSWAPWNRGMAGLDERIQYRLTELAGVPAPRSSYFQLRVIDDPLEQPATQYDGDLWGLYMAFENQDNRFKEAHGMPDGNIFRMQLTGAGNHLLGQGANQPSDLSDLNAFVSSATGYNRTLLQPEAWWRTNLDLAKYYSWRAVNEAVNNTDIRDQENVVYFREPATGLWHIEPWDSDLLYEQFDRWGPEATQSTAPYEQLRRSLQHTNLLIEFQNRARELQDLLLNGDQAWKLVDESLALITDGSASQPGFVEVDRRRWDYNPINPTPPRGVGPFGNYYKTPYPVPNMGLGPPQPFFRTLASADFAGMVTWVKTFIAFDAHGGARLANLANDPTIPVTPSLLYVGDPAFAADGLIMQCSGFVSPTNRTFTAMRWRLGEVFDPSVPNFAPGEPWRYEVTEVWSSGDLPSFGSQLTIPAAYVREGHTYRARVKFQDSGGRWSHWSDPVQFTTTSSGAARIAQSLIVSELMYNPPVFGGVSGDEFEFLELKNVGQTPLNLGGLAFTAGIQFSFTNGTQLAPGATFLLAHNPAQLAAKYPGVVAQGAFSGTLNNGGERLTLAHPVGGVVLSFTYDDELPWPVAPDNFDFSLVPVDDTAPFDHENPRNWRASRIAGGSPGQGEPPGSIPPVLVNEVLTRTILPAVDWIELFNPTTNTVNVGGWFLTDDPAVPKKFRIPNGTTIGPGGYRVYDESDFNAPPGASNAFSLRSAGDEIVLYSGDANTNFTGYSHGFRFGASANAVTFGRHVLSTGEEQFPAQSAPTPNGVNSGPLIGPVVITEIHYHAPDPQDEFVELRNISAAPVPLFAGTNGWKLDGLGFTFPTNATLEAGRTMLLVATTPANFRVRFGVPANVAILGPYAGQLQDSGERLELLRPEVIESNGLAYVSVDEVRYNDRAPWPFAADGGGASLQRKNPPAYGNDPASWDAAGPTPGLDFIGGSAPSILFPPQSQAVLIGQTAQFTVVAGGAAPLNYQWAFNGEAIAGATRSNLVLNSVTFGQAGNYTVTVFNQGGASASAVAHLSVATPLLILVHPTNVAVVPGSNATFRVAAAGNGVLRFQWRKDDLPIDGANAAVLSIPNAQLTNAGVYTCLVTDSIGSIVTTPVQLIILIEPLITLHPVSQTILTGATVVLSVTVTNTATLPVGYRLRRNGVTLPATLPGVFQVLTQRTAYFTLAGTNTSPPWTTYAIIVTNQARPNGNLSTVATLTYDADTDGNGLPDSWETRFFGAPGANPKADSDGDGMKNGQEYLAGTDPTNALSFLALDGRGLPAALQFEAAPGRTYTVQFTDALESAPWRKLFDVPARTTNYLHLLPDAGTNRFYRLVTPQQPADFGF